MDKRKNNGGNSTKSNGIDKRKNKYLNLLEEASTEEDIIKVIKNLKNIAMKETDIQAIRLYLEYYLGKPKETIETTHNINDFNIKELFKVDKDKS
jgi:hypothetical protein